MDKHTFAAYEYLPTTNPEAETDQFFVLQDDGTFALNRQVQYVAEVQDVNETMDGTQACAVYDVDPQQFYVDVANNPGELISVSDNFIMPAATGAEEVNNLYGNSFLLQTVGTEAEASAQAEKDMTITVQFKDSDEQEEVDVVNIVNNTCTEITLSDEQYTCLEEKGWVLIENNGKIYILDALGLHEVTTNQGLVQSLKDENKIETSVETDSTGVVKDSPKYPTSIEDVNNELKQLEERDFEIPAVEQKQKEKEQIKLETNESKNIEGPKLFEQPPDDSAEKLKEFRLHPEPQNYHSSKIKILTKYNFKDIPDKIVLGRTRNGKRLVAKVVKRTVGDCSNENNDDAKPEDSAVEPAISPEDTIRLINEDESKAIHIDGEQFESLIRRAVRGEIECSSAEVVDASDVITQLFQVPEFSSSVAGRNVVITKISEKKLLGRTHQKITLVSGFVKSNENSSGLLFIHVPDLLKKMTYEYDEFFLKQSSRSVLKPISEKIPACKILQVHITETKHNGVQAISFVLKERMLPQMKPVSVGARRASLLHACSACAAIFQSRAELAEHQAEYNHAMDSDELTIDTDKLPKDQTFTIMESQYYVVNTKGGTEYCCFQCPKRFNKLTDCTRHMRFAHSVVPAPKSVDDQYCDDPLGTPDKMEDLDVPSGDYKCNMCPTAYHHPASLSKHIKKAHIQPRRDRLLVGVNRPGNRAVT
ncbi:hypothetical protein O0L34_g439 [Tuta absoluta]|nr:hypothetical protein O0L34_g439 [Tuta absoluta]